jgi:hypothetical protein
MAKLTTIHNPENEMVQVDGSISVSPEMVQGVQPLSVPMVMINPPMMTSEPAVIRVEAEPRIVEVIKEVKIPVEIIKEVEKIVYVDRPVEVIKEVQVEVEKIVERKVEVPVEVIKESVKVIEIPKITIKEKVPAWAILVMCSEAVLLLASLLLK